MPTELVPLSGNTRTRSLSRTLAVTGALQQHGHTGHEVLRALRDYRFRGRRYPVHESGRPVRGIPGYRTIADLPTAPDLIVVAAEGHDPRLGSCPPLRHVASKTDARRVRAERP